MSSLCRFFSVGATAIQKRHCQYGVHLDYSGVIGGIVSGFNVVAYQHVLNSTTRQFDHTKQSLDSHNHC